jgi:hypothetical protein
MPILVDGWAFSLFINIKFMRTAYKPSYDILSPIQMRNRPTHINNVVQEEIKKNVLTYNFSVEIAEDKEALQAFQDIPGVVAFKATLRKGPSILGFGYGMAVINETNKYYSKQIAFAANSAWIDSVVKASKLIDVLPASHNGQQESKESPSSFYRMEQTNNFQPASEKQKNYLLQLLKNNQASETEIEQVYELSKKEAAEKISFLAPAR